MVNVYIVSHFDGDKVSIPLSVVPIIITYPVFSQIRRKQDSVSLQTVQDILKLAGLYGASTTRRSFTDLRSGH